ncbi:lantibiotic dehydratase [Staphylococcus delphini]|uniref:lantibiotic dehydratase n=1 Tax=Staphylococcus delphini TaxID=53344 RepID=UPI0023B335CA|nr:lantibiotic dehydratase [Staphylococcus delphini]MDE9751762.1 thiopeptide-type bacteriocin biosynthesis protein [Staphylococcus delphini]MDE9789039.1 thiopeptide-type bacteriocin biosynthesis protein [Staphylococcus delphini]MDE9791328.1 thiopeptide-type bacteriocin biosynthesis protein [Staphylococcus delphini]MDE9793658.1 thiopeptide-type bacteriocin biosynthesis protein [Staphylococcus delphini]MDE9795992.1 thiopeptide-type bacteriocin biosynthesis protein [Staphylococcus delphini]
MELFNYYLYRTPLLSISKFKEIERNDLSDREYVLHLIKYVEKHNLYANIYSSSKSLYHSITNFTMNTSDKKTRSILISLYKYLVRMMFRPTPFGMYSGVGVNNIYNQNFDGEEKITYFGYINNSLLYLFIDFLHGEDKILDKIKIHVNPNIYEDKTHHFLPYQVQYGSNNYNDTGNVSLQKNKLTQRVIHLCGHGIYFKQLKEIICEEFLASEAVVKEYLQKMIFEDFLVSEFKINFSDKNSYKKIMKKLEDLNETESIVYDLLESIDIILKELLTTDNRSIVLKLLMKADNLVAAKFSNFKENVINIDTKISGRNFQITNEDILNIEKIANLNSRLSIFEPSKVLEEYKKEFSEIYGQDEDVRLTELLNLSTGLGLPNEYNRTNNSNNLEKANSIARILENWKTEALLKNKKTIKLNESKFMELEPYLKKGNMHTSFDMYLTKLSNSSMLYFRTNSGSLQATQTYGRFLYMFSSNLSKEIYEFNNYKPKEMDSIEVIYNHPSSKIQNVMTSNIPSKVIDFSNPNASVTSNDLYVFLGEDFNFYIRDIKGNILYPNFNNMHNTNLAPGIIRFLSDISMQYISGHYFLAYFITEQAYFPRIEYENLVLSPRKWNVKLESSLDFNMFISRINEFSKTYDLDEEFYLVYEDQRLYINWKYNISQYILYNEYKKGKNLELEELEKDFDFEESSTLNELVFSYSSTTSLKLEDAVNLSQPTIRNEKETILPGNEWLSLNLYYNEYNFKELMSYGLWEKVFKELLKSKEIDTTFFIRYRDSNDHLRLRFRIPSKDSLIQKKILDLINTFKNNGYIKTFSITPYYRETYRYGGTECIKVAEECFQVDSKIVLKYYGDLVDNLDVLDFAIDNIIEILNYFRPSINSQILTLEFIGKNKVVKDLYREKRNRILKSINQNQKFIEAHGTKKWREDKYNAYISLLKKSNKLNDNSIVLSIIHMFCNRLLGTDRELESKVIELIYRALLDYEKIKQLN